MMGNGAGSAGTGEPPGSLELTSEAGVYPSPEYEQHPYGLFERLRTEAPVYKVPCRGETYLVTRHDDIRFVNRHPEIFSSSTPLHKGADGARASGGAPPATMLAADPPELQDRRSIGRRPFTPGRLKIIEPDVQRFADALIDNFIGRGECDFVNEFAIRLPLLVTCYIMGLPEEDQDLLLYFGRGAGPGQRYLLPTEQEADRQRGQAMASYVKRRLVERHESPRDDALSELIQLQIERDGDFDLDYLVPEAALLISGGLITTAHMMSSAMMLLLANSSQMERVREDFALIPRMLEEALRLESPVQWQPRATTEDTELGGVPIPKGSLVLLCYAAGNRDDTHFECPIEFDIGRENVKDHFAFGYGPHFCLGAPLARLEGRIAFERLLTRLHDVQLAPDQLPIVSIHSMVFRAPASLRVTFVRAEGE